MCFGAKDNSYGSFTAPLTGHLVAVKLVHRFGYVCCHARRGSYWSFWGCGERHSDGLVNTIITDHYYRILMPKRSWRGTLIALNGTRSLDITQNLLRLYCHVFPQFQCFEESGYVCGMVKICSIMAKKIMPAEYAAKFMPCIPQRSSLQFED